MSSGRKAFEVGSTRVPVVVEDLSESVEARESEVEGRRGRARRPDFDSTNRKSVFTTAEAKIRRR